MLLAELLADACPPEKLAVAHFDHALRTDSAADADFCQKWAEKKGIRCFVERWTEPAPSEDKARQARRAFLFAIRERLKADAIALGTHADDQAETVFFRFLRGSGPLGLAGIKRFDRKTRLFRPLLGLTKAEIMAMLADRGADFCQDSTNSDLRFARNFIRHKVFPLLDERFPGFRRRLCAQTDIFRQTAQHLRQSARNFLKLYPPQAGSDERMIDRVAFVALPAVIKAEVLRLLVAPRVPDAAETKRLCAFIAGARSGKRARLAGCAFTVFTRVIVVTPDAEAR
jgi:tRNA(Ile)-lysidine synthase